MESSTLFSIGHGLKEMPVFIDELKSFDIQYLIDIRSIPYSKWATSFNQIPLKMALDRNGIKYSHWGKELGGRPDDRTCYDNDGKVVYDIIKEKDFFQEGLDRLVAANQKYRLALMCTEMEPEKCHRSKLIGEELLKRRISIQHIISAGVVKSQENIISGLTGGWGMIPDLFGERKGFISRKSY